ncbi:NIPSNAP family protein [Sphaerotilus sp.]|uniref:NIPSNAP family protein n=1 Tax=Sphaerotilus sp. TaxID=2093942 RepID=UPI0034E29BB7
MHYELATLTIRLGTLNAAVAAIDAYVHAPEAVGMLMGCWFSDVGALNQIAVLRRFDDQTALDQERQRGLFSANPFGCSEYLTALDMASYRGFPWMAPIEPGAFGPIYEIRTYEYKIGGLQPTIEAWEAAMPARSAVSPCLVAMYALDGTPRFTHIWPAASLNDRSAARAEAVRLGVWPPKGGPAWLTTNMRSDMFLPTAISPLK